jgi:hypothetical protein
MLQKAKVYYSVTEQVNIELTLWICIWEVQSSKHGWDTPPILRSFHDFPQSIQSNAKQCLELAKNSSSRIILNS